MKIGWKGRFAELWRSESAQATAEYILILAVAVSLAVIVVNRLIRPIFGRLGRAIIRRLDDALFGNDLHRFPIGR